MQNANFNELKAEYLRLLEIHKHYGADELDMAEAAYISYIISHPNEFDRYSPEGEILQKYTELANFTRRALPGLISHYNN